MTVTEPPLPPDDINKPQDPAPDDFLKALQSEIDDIKAHFTLRAGVVTTFGSLLSITLGGESTILDNIPYLDHVFPYVGAKVWIAEFGDQLMVIGTQKNGAAGGGRPGEVFWHWSDSETLPGALLCYGQTITNCDTTYPGLWAYSPAAAKSGTSLTLPDLRGRTIHGRDNMGGSDAGRLTTSNTIGTTGGAESHSVNVAHTHGGGSLSAAYGGDHSHTIDPPTNGTLYNAAAGSGGSGNTINWMGSTSTSYTGGHTHTVSGTTDSSGSGGTVDHMDPFITLNGFIVV